MYQVIIIEDDPMVASINKQYVELTPSFRVIKVFKSGIEALEYLNDDDLCQRHGYRRTAFVPRCD